jgi:hypothetical protein
LRWPRALAVLQAPGWPSCSPPAAIDIDLILWIARQSGSTSFSSLSLRPLASASSYKTQQLAIAEEFPVLGANLVPPTAEVDEIQIMCFYMFLLY